MTDTLFMGNAICSVDADRGLILPAFILAPLALRSDAATILLGSHEADPCLVAYDPAQVAALQGPSVQKKPRARRKKR